MIDTIPASKVLLTVNGENVEGLVDDRTSVADFLREKLGLTGTHLGCEQGVCGACTIEIDGVPSRSCITLVRACDGAKIRTIEGYDNDPIMVALRNAFSESHALQCGFCKDSEVFPIFQHAGVEFVYILEGRMIRRQLNAPYKLAPGDSPVFDSDAAHGPEELVELPVSFLSVITRARDS